MGLISIAFSAILVQNVILSRFLGICPFLGVSNKSKSSIGMGLAVVFVITLSSVVSWLIYYYLLDAFSMTYMRTIVFILVIASLVQIIEMFLKKFIPSLYKALGIYLPLITTNCAVLGVATLSIDNNYNLLETLTFAFASSVGFLLVIYIFSTLREKMNRTENSFSGIPIALITAGIMAMIFARFAGVI